jgi:hypothetical protein
MRSVQNFWDDPQIWDGAGGAILGAILGGLVSFGVAMLVVSRTHHADREMAQHQRSLEVATGIYERLDSWSDVLDKARAATETTGEMTAEMSAFLKADASKGLTSHLARLRESVDAAQRALAEAYAFIEARAFQIDDAHVVTRLGVHVLALGISRDGLFTYLAVADMEGADSLTRESALDHVQQRLEESREALDAIRTTLRSYLAPLPS